MKRLLSMLLVTCLLLSMIPAVYADNERNINEVAITDLATPVVGQLPDREVTIPEGKGYSLYQLFVDNLVVWYDITKDRFMQEGETFKLNHGYRAVIYLEANAGYRFNSEYDDQWDIYTYNMTGTVNGQEAAVIKTSAHEADEFVCVQYTFNVLCKYDVFVSWGRVFDEDGNQVNSAYAGQKLTACADMGMGEFAGWNPCEGVEFADMNAKTTTFIMPDHAVELSYKETEKTPQPISSVELKLAGFHRNANVKMLQVTSQTENTWIGYNEATDMDYVLVEDNGGMPGTTPVTSGTISSSKRYWIGIIVNSYDGFYFSNDTAVTMSGAANTIVLSVSECEVKVFFQLPAALVSRGFSVTVNNGTAYVNNTEITTTSMGMEVAAYPAEAPEGMYFSRWETINITLEDPYSEYVYFTMPGKNVTLTAVYESYITSVDLVFDDPVYGQPIDFTPEISEADKVMLYKNVSDDQYFDGIQWWHTDGNIWMEPGEIFGVGDYSVHVALTPKPGYKFDPNGVTVLCNGQPCEFVVQEAMLGIYEARCAFELKEIPYYNLEIYDADAYDARGEQIWNAYAGQTVYISACESPEGKVFGGWKIMKGNITLDNPRDANTSFVMGQETVALRAVYNEPMEYNGHMYTLYCGMTVDMALTEDLYIDLNGHELYGRIITNGYKVYCIDSATDAYTFSGAGMFACYDENDDQIVPELHVKTTEAMAGAVKRYLRVQDADGTYSFHRFYIGITHTTIRPSVTGIGYKAMFCGSSKVMEQLDATKAFGYSIRLDGNKTVTAFKTCEEVVSGQMVTLRIDNFDTENYGKTNLFANVQIILKDGTVIESSEVSTSLFALLNHINENVNALTTAQLTAIAEMIENDSTMQGWNLNNIN